MSKNIVLGKSFDFGLDIVKLYLRLKNEKEYILSNQLVRSATSIGANITEAQYSPSKKDFINKMNIALKEANESEYWLKALRFRLLWCSWQGPGPTCLRKDLSKEVHTVQCQQAPSSDRKEAMSWWNKLWKL